ncbi:MAG: FliG C-terminal domain-containing protein [Hyphomicrobiaceae bacterium]
MKYGIDGATKAALLLLAVQREKAVELLKRLDPDEVRLIASGAEQLASVTPEMLAGVIGSFKESFSDGIKFLGTTNEVRKLIVEAGLEAIDDPPANAEELERIPKDLWSSINQLPIEELKSYLAVQHSQVAAFILSRMESEQVALLMQDLDGDICADLLTRMLSKGQPAPEIVRAVEIALTEDLMKDKGARGGQGRIELASILNRLDRARASNVINRLRVQSPSDAKAVEQMLFRFEDLPRLAAKALTAVVEQMPVDQLVLSLHGTDGEFQNCVLGVMSARARRMAESEIQNAVEPNARAVAAARQVAVEVVLRLAATGALELPSEM